MKNEIMWSAPVEGPEDIKQLNKDSAKFMFELAEKRLKNLLETSDRTTNRAVSLLTASIPLVAFILSGLFKHYFNSEHLSTQLLNLSWVSLICTIGSNTLLAIIIFPRDMHQMGREPQAVFISDFVKDPQYKDDEQYKLLLIVEIEELQRRITFMQKQSNQRIKLLKIGFLTLVGLGGVCSLTLLLLGLFP